ncbi:hypothetical protein [Streptomyces eurythermus]|uniref:hypothetical protein n=1 Tax=Streptomyces eurythermus TaxID=42237 RepID=UPI0036D3639C
MKRELSMLVHQAEFTVDLGESGYLIGFTEHGDYPGDVMDAWPQEEQPLRVHHAPGQDGWIRMRLYCQTDDPEPGIGDHGERHLIQLWPAPATPPVHPTVGEDDLQARAQYAADRSGLLADCTIDLPVQD